MQPVLSQCYALTTISLHVLLSLHFVPCTFMQHVPVLSLENSPAKTLLLCKRGPRMGRASPAACSYNCPSLWGPPLQLQATPHCHHCNCVAVDSPLPTARSCTPSHAAAAFDARSRGITAVCCHGCVQLRSIITPRSQHVAACVRLTAQAPQKQSFHQPPPCGARMRWAWQAPASQPCGACPAAPALPAGQWRLGALPSGP